MIVAVSVNHSGPYNFLLDTGTQITMVDPSLAAELHLNTQESAVVTGVGFDAAASFAQLDLLEVGSHSVASQKILVFGIKNPRSADIHFRGVLGEDFLSKFDVLIDNAHNLLCLDDSAAMRADVKGPHIALVTADETTSDSSSFRSLIISARLSDGRPVRLKLDSGTNVAFLFDTSKYVTPGSTRSAGGGLNGAQRSYLTLPPQDLKIGSLKFPRVSFSTTLADSRKDSRRSDYDGLLTLGLFRRVLICHADHFAVFEPW
jgi:hypothetical protein